MVECAPVLGRAELFFFSNLCVNSSVFLSAMIMKSSA